MCHIYVKFSWIFLETLRCSLHSRNTVLSSSSWTSIILYIVSIISFVLATFFASIRHDYAFSNHVAILFMTVIYQDDFCRNYKELA